MSRLESDAGSEGNKKVQDALLGTLDSSRNAFQAALDDDLDVASALAVVFDLVRAVSKALDQKAVSKTLARQVADFFWNDFDAVFGVLKKQAALDVPQAVLALLEEREAARKAKDFKKSDALRAQIKALGFAVDDTGKGAKVKPV